MSAINDLKHAVAFHRLLYVGGVPDIDPRKVDMGAANRGLGRVNEAVARALRDAPRGLVAEGKLA